MYQVLVNQIAAMIGMEVRVPMNIYKQSKEDIRRLAHQILRGKALRSQYSIRNACKYVWNCARKKLYSRRRG